MTSFYLTRSKCRECCNTVRRSRETPPLDPEKKRQISEYQRKWRDKGGKRKQRDADVRRLYGITMDQVDELLEAQGHGCAICGGANVAGRRLAVDHDHATGVVRGLLCCGCNRGIGYFKDDPNRMVEAMNYLISHRAAWLASADGNP